MPRGCRWIWLPRSSTGGDMPGVSQSWDTCVARDGSGRIHVRLVGEVTQEGTFESPEELVGFFDDYGDDALRDLRDAVERVHGFKEVARMINFRLGDLDEVLADQIDAGVDLD